MQFVRSDWVVVSISLWFLIACLISCFVMYIDRLASLGGVSVYFLFFYFFSSIFIPKTDSLFSIIRLIPEIKMGYCINILTYIISTLPPPPPIPPFRLRTYFYFLLLREDWIKHSPLKTSIKYGFPLGRVLWKLKPHPQRIPYYFSLP